jgi:hypothetical protein
MCTTLYVATDMFGPDIGIVAIYNLTYGCPSIEWPANLKTMSDRQDRHGRRKMITLNGITITLNDKKDIIIPGWAIPLALLTSPIWIIPASPWIAPWAWKHGRQKLKDLQLATYRSFEPHTQRRNLTLPPPTTAAPASEPPPSLLTIPIELREQILHYLLNPTPKLTITTSPKTHRLFATAIGHHYTTSTHHILPTLQTHSQLYREGTHLLYSRNIFSFPERATNSEPIARFTTFTRQLAPHSLRLIKHLQLAVVLDCSINKTGTSVLTSESAREWKTTRQILRCSMIGLSTLHIHIKRRFFKGAISQRGAGDGFRLDLDHPRTRKPWGLEGIGARDHTVVVVSTCSPRLVTVTAD